jgi:predicted DNA-binding protein
MELRLEPKLAAKVEQWSAETGRPADELVEDAITGYFREFEEIKATLNSRYDDIVSGRVKAIPGEEAIRMLRERAAAREISGSVEAAERPKARG